MALTLLLISCDVSTLVAAPPPTPLPPGGIATIVVQTAQAAASQTAALLPPTLTPTLTPAPTKTPTETPSPSPTFLFILATMSRTPTEAPVSSSGGGSGDFACKLLDQSPADESTMSKNQVFTASWKLQNTGATTWNTNAVDFVYLSGAKIASVKAADLPKSVDSGDSVTLKLSMTAPSDSGRYKTVWTLQQGKTQFCRVSLTIIVP
ncbi:MAG: NBR1-Ig-like domain-containing protein [Anaerolineae bacterium]